MCTLSMIRSDLQPGPPHVRIVMNRDEQRTRPASLPPTLRVIDGTSIIMPIDPASGGTWIAATSRGLVLAILNANPGMSTYAGARGLAFSGRRSRGEIIPALAGSATLCDAAESLRSFIAREYPPFLVIALDAQECFVARSDGSALTLDPIVSVPDAEVWSSSGLGDDRVIGPRRELFFSTLTRTPGSRFRAQEQFHQHAWPDRPEISVLMRRADARTFSRTVLDLFPALVRMTCDHLDEQLRPEGSGVTLELPLARTHAEQSA